MSGASRTGWRPCHLWKGETSSLPRNAIDCARINEPPDGHREGVVLLLDTSSLIDLEHELADRRVGPVRTFLGRHPGQAVASTTITVGELAAGSDEEAIRFFLRRLRKLPLTEAIAYRAGALDRALMREGKRLGENDNWIAATALHYSATLVYSDGDFDRVPRLKRRHVRRRQGGRGRT